MRGDQVIPIPVPNSGLRTDKPPHQTPPDALVAGSNVYIGQDGLLHPRAGYSAVMGAANTINARINGGYAFQDQSGDFQYIVNTDTQWWALGDIGVTWDTVTGIWSTFVGNWDDFTSFFGWTNITNATYPLVGAVTDPGRYAVFFEGGYAWIVGVDNYSTPVAWNSSLSEYVPVNYSPYAISGITGDGTTATVTLTTAVTNISIGDSITIAGNSQPAFNVATTVTQVLSGTQLQFASTESSPGSGGTLTDQTTLVMPPARDISVIANRMVIVNTTENGTRYSHRVRWSTEGDFTRWPVLAYIDVLDMEDDPIVGIQPLGQNYGGVFGQNSLFILSAQAGDDANAFSVERLQTADKYSGPASPAALLSAEGLQYWLSYDGRIRSFDGVNVTPASPPIDAALQPAFDTVNASKCHASYLQSVRQVLFFFPTTTLTDIQGDPSACVALDLYRQIFLPFYEFSEGITASFDGQVNDSLTWINVQGTWNTVPYTWEDAPNELETDTFIATANGEVDSFFRGVLDGDNMFIVPYGATWTYLYDPQNILKFLYAEFFFVPVTGSVGGIEYVTMSFQSLLYPYDTGTPLVSFAVSMQAGWTNQPTEPGPSNPANISNNLIAMSLSSSESKGGAGFAGGALYGVRIPRGQYGPGGT